MSKKLQAFVAAGFLLVGGGGVATGIWAQAIKGSALVANVICVSSKNPNCGIVVDTDSAFTPIKGEYSGTGGFVPTRDVVRIASPFSSTAYQRGLKTGTGVVWELQAEVIANPNGASIDVTKVAGINTATGGTALFSNLSATGTIQTYSTPFVLGPTEFIKGGSTSVTTNGLVIEIRGRMTSTNVTN